MGARDSAGRAGRVLPAAVLTGALAFAYLWVFRAYGLNVEDEGTLLYQIVRTARGELPYADFATGYTPGFFLLGAWLWETAGDVVSLRIVLATVHAGTAAALAALGARVARPSVALVLPWIYLSFIPVFPGEFCAFNVPYPAWFATAGWIATALCMLGFVDGRHRGWLVGAGTAAAFTLAMKPNAGVFAIAAATAVLLALRDPARAGGAGIVALWMLLWGGIVGGVWVVFGLTRMPTELVVFILPVAAAMSALVTLSRVRRRALPRDAASLLVPFAALSLPWMGFFVARLGLDGFLRDVLLLGSNAAALYYVFYPGLEVWAVAITMVAVTFAVGGWFVAQGRLPAQPALAVVAIGLVCVGAAVPMLGVMPEGFVWSVIWQLQRAGFALTLAAHAAGVVWLWFRGRRPSNVVPLLLLLFGLFMHLQLYPRMDFMHLVMAMPLSMIFAGYLLERVYDSWERGFAAMGRHRLGRLTSVTATLLLAGIATLAATPARWVIASSAEFALPVSTVPVRLEETHASKLRALAATAEDLARILPPGGTSVGFPAAAATLLLSGAVNPVPHDYFYPGRPDHREEAMMLDRLAADPPAALVSMNARLTYFHAAPAYYHLFRRFVREHYVRAARHGRYDVLVRRGLPWSPAPARDTRVLPPELATLPTRRASPAELAPALLHAATSTDGNLRRAGVTLLLDVLAEASGDGLESVVDAAALDRRDRVLVLRTLRDLRDPRAASYLFAELDADDARVVGEALGAMYVTRAHMVARRHLWDATPTPPVLLGREALRAAVRHALADADAAPRAVAFAAELALALHDAGSVPALRDRWRAATRLAVAMPGGAALPPTGPATVASVAAALTALAPAGIACDLPVVLARAQPAILEVVPSLLRNLAERAGPLGVEARRCLRRALDTGKDPVRAEVIWVAAGLPDADLLAATGRALAAGDPAVRRAAAWALGEAAALPERLRALERLATTDPDPLTRQVAAGAVAKQAGRRPRSLGAGRHDAS